ncbi:unnamed protein product [Prunus armeniaca]|uniref:Uncharacterized protein n=1 Tax=Prunus armeniaca TaxID=36596 RepID=A0A6J5U173_PRUAR|nr:unnamed protein product [Prunus armeniaca]
MSPKLQVRRGLNPTAIPNPTQTQPNPSPLQIEKDDEGMACGGFGGNAVWLYYLFMFLKDPSSD